jgi:hypothetical protein
LALNRPQSYVTDGLSHHRMDNNHAVLRSEILEFVERKVRAESYYCAMDGPNIRRILAYRSHLGLLVR